MRSPSVPCLYSLAGGVAGKSLSLSLVTGPNTVVLVVVAVVVRCIPLNPVTTWVLPRGYYIVGLWSLYILDETKTVCKSRAPLRIFRLVPSPKKNLFVY